MFFVYFLFCFFFISLSAFFCCFFSPKKNDLDEKSLLTQFVTLVDDMGLGAFYVMFSDGLYKNTPIGLFPHRGNASYHQASANLNSEIAHWSQRIAELNCYVVDQSETPNKVAACFLAMRPGAKAEPRFAVRAARVPKVETVATRLAGYGDWYLFTVG